MVDNPIHHDQDPTLPTRPIPEVRQRLERLQDQNNTLVCVGLDTEYDLIPEHIKRRNMMKDRAVVEFNSEIIRQTSDLVCAYKPNLAFYEANGVWGRIALGGTVNAIKDLASDVVILADAKRGDIGNTVKEQAKDIYENIGADATTINAFGGSSRMVDGQVVLEDLAPFLDYKDKLSYVWTKGSNAAGGEFQDLPVTVRHTPQFWKDRFGNLNDLDEMLHDNGISAELEASGYEPGDVPLFLVMAYKMNRDWNVNNNLGYVVGATYPRELKWVRKIVGDASILVPGLGAQNGSEQDVVDAGLDGNKKGMVVNAARSVIYASSGEDFGKRAREEATKLRDKINQYRAAA